MCSKKPVSRAIIPIIGADLILALLPASEAEATFLLLFICSNEGYTNGA